MVKMEKILAILEKVEKMEKILAILEKIIVTIRGLATYKRNIGKSKHAVQHSTKNIHPDHQKFQQELE